MTTTIERASREVQAANEAPQDNVLATTELTNRSRLAAARFLRHRGYDVLEQDWECKAGVADLVAQDKDGTLVFFILKTRTGSAQGFPKEDTSVKKREKMEKIAACFLKDHDFKDVPVRFDIMSLIVIGESRAFLRHHLHAFSG